MSKHTENLKKLFTTPTIIGECKIKFDDRSKGVTIPFKSTYTKEEAKIFFYNTNIMFGKKSDHQTWSKIEGQNLVLMDIKSERDFGNFIVLEKKVPLKNITMLWCKYHSLERN